MDFCIQRKYLFIISDTQLWKLEDEMLVNKAGLFHSHDSWMFHDDKAIIMIQNLVRKQVLGIQDGTRFVSLEAGQTLERRKFNATHFKLEVSTLALTKNTAGDFIESKNTRLFYL